MTKINCANVLVFHPSGFPVGAVVGGVIGVLLLLTVCISTVVFFKKRNNGEEQDIFTLLDALVF